MGIFTDNPVLEREVRGRLRLKRKNGVAANLWIARLIGAIAAYYYVRGMIGVWRGTLQDARDLWPLLVYGALVLIVLLSPALSSTAITQEREQQTWEILATTQLSAWEVLGGKWLGRQMIPWLLLVILLPFMVVAAARAELGFLELPIVLLFLLLTIACYSALGLVCSFQAKRTMTATASALTASAFLCVGTVVINQVWLLLANRSGPGQDTPVMWANPFYIVNTLMMQLSPNTFGSDGSSDPTSTLWYFLLTTAATVAALAFMVRRYHRSVRGRG